MFTNSPVNDLTYTEPITVPFIKHPISIVKLDKLSELVIDIKLSSVFIIPKRLFVPLAPLLF